MTFLDKSGVFCYTQASPEHIFRLLQKHTDETYHIISEVMDVLCVWLAQFSRQSSQTTLLKV